MEQLLCDKVMDWREVCRMIADHYGREKQQIQAVQELSELIMILTRRPDQRGENHRQQVLTEIADCEIMLEQMRQLYKISEDEVSAEIDRKLLRQIDRIDKEVFMYDP